MKIFGHPVHMMLVHFPSAFFPASLVCTIAAFCTGNVAFSSMAFYATGAGVVMGWLAACFGALDFMKAVTKNKTAVNPALVHASVNLTVVIIFTLFFCKSFKSGAFIEPSGIVTLCIKSLAVAFMLVGNYFGGNLVLKYKVVE